MKQTKLKTLLYEKGITQKVLAEAIGKTEKTVSSKMKGEKEFTLSEIYIICELLCVSNPFDIFLR